MKWLHLRKTAGNAEKDLHGEEWIKKLGVM
jgi:hypothetical protein